MTIDMSQLQQLIGKRLKGLVHDISRTIPIQSSQKVNEDIDLHLQMLFDEYTINIYNRHSFDESNLEDFKNQVLSNVDETDSEVIFHFGSKSIRVDMTDQGYTGPEALSLYGPNNLIAVWS